MRAEVVHVLAPGEHADADLLPALRSLAEDRYVLVCRRGGAPSRLERVKAFLLRRPIEAVTVVADESRAEGEEFEATVVETDLAGVYEVVERAGD